MFEKKINPNISTGNTTLTIAKTSTITPPTESPSAIQNTTYMGREVSYTPSTPSTNMPTYLPPTYVDPSSSSQFRGSVAPPYSSLVLQANSTSRSMDDVNVKTSVVNIANLSQENIKRRSFFFLLKDRLTEYLNSNSCIICCGATYDKERVNQSWVCCIYPLGTSEAEGARQFATRVALGFTYMYQDIIPLLDTESNERLADYFFYLIHPFLSAESSRAKSIYSILMNSLNRYLPESENCNVKNLKTVDGFTFSFNHLLSLGVITTDGDLYEATNPRNVELFKELKDRNNFPHYRWGTLDAIKIDVLLHADLKPTYYNPKRIHLREVEDSVSNHVSRNWKVIWVESGSDPVDYERNVLQEGAFKEFWDKADDLAKNYLNQDEIQSYTKLIPAGSGSVFLLRSNVASSNIPDNRIRSVQSIPFPTLPPHPLLGGWTIN